MYIKSIGEFLNHQSLHDFDILTYEDVSIFETAKNPIQ